MQHWALNFSVGSPGYEADEGARRGHASVHIVLFSSLAGIHLDQHCLPGHNGHLGQGGYLEHSEQVTHFAGCGRILVQKLRPVSREDSAEDYYDILLVKNHSGGDQPKLHEYAPTASLPRIPHTVLISEETHQLAMQSSLMSPSTNPLAVQPVTSSAVPLSSHSTSSAYPATIPLAVTSSPVPLSSCSTSSAYPASSPLAVTASSPTSLSRPTAIVPCITSTALPTSSGIDTIAEGLVQDRISQICLLESAELHCGSDSIGSHVEDTNASPLRLMGTLDLGAPDDVDKDGTVSGNTCPMATGSEVGKTFNILGGGGLSNTSGEKDLRIASDLGMVSRTSQATNGGELGVAFNAGHLGMGRSGQATGQATNGGELRMASSARQIGVKSSSTGGVQAQHPSSNGSCVSYPGTSCNYGNRKNQTLIPRHGSDPGTVPVFLKKRNLCDVTRAFSEPTAVSCYLLCIPWFILVVFLSTE